MNLNPLVNRLKGLSAEQPLVYAILQRASLVPQPDEYPVQPEALRSACRTRKGLQQTFGEAEP